MKNKKNIADPVGVKKSVSHSVCKNVKKLESTLSPQEIKKLKYLGERISLSLSPLADLSEVGIPSRTNRFAMIELMKQYLEIHGYKLNIEIGQPSDKGNH